MNRDLRDVPGDSTDGSNDEDLCAILLTEREISVECNRFIFIEPLEFDSGVICVKAETGDGIGVSASV